MYVLFKKDTYPRILLDSIQSDVEEGGLVPVLFQSNLCGSVPYYLMILRQYFHYYLILKCRMAKQNTVKTEYCGMLKQFKQQPPTQCYISSPRYTPALKHCISGYHIYKVSFRPHRKCCCDFSGLKINRFYMAFTSPALLRD